MDLKAFAELMLANNAAVTKEMRSKLVGAAPELADDEMLVEHPNAGTIAERFEVRRLEPAPRSYEAQTLGGLCEAVHRLHTLFSKDENPVLVFVSDGCVEAVLGERTRRERVRMELKKSDGYTTLESKKIRSLSHQDFIDTLRLEYRNEVTPPEFVPAVKKLKFNRSDSGYSELAVGRESMGKAVLNEAMADGQAIAEEVVLAVQVFENVNEDVSRPQGVRCGVRVDLREGKLGLTPLAGELHSLMHKTLDDIAEFLRQGLPEDVEVVNGVVV